MMGVDSPCLFAERINDSNKFSFSYVFLRLIFCIISNIVRDLLTLRAFTGRLSCDSNISGAETVIFTGGKVFRCELDFRYEKRECCKPSIPIGMILAPLFAANIAGPSYIFIKTPVVVIRPSGKTTIGSPATSCFTAFFKVIGCRSSISSFDMG